MIKMPSESLNEDFQTAFSQIGDYKSHQFNFYGFT